MRTVQGDVARISVVDTGAGIKPEDQARLFEAFEQFETTPTHRQEGSGLGLCLSHKLAQLLGASITCDSQPGEGSTFTVTVPAVVPATSVSGREES